MTTISRPEQEHADPLKIGGEQAFPLWTTTLDELANEDGWLLELESPELYLTLKVLDRSILERAVIFLNSALTLRQAKKPPYRPETDELALGRFGDATAFLLRDNEDFIRCFLVVRAGDSCTLRISLDAKSIQALAEALHNI